LCFLLHSMAQFSEHPFESNKLRCVLDPEAAALTLTPFAYLDVHVERAAELRNNDWGAAILPDSLQRADPFVRLSLNDVQVGQDSDVKLGTLNPEWNHHFYPVAVHHPASVLRVEVWDWDLATRSDPIGFVEIPLADVPFDSAIQGHFELRRWSKLVGKAPSRIAEHRRRSDDPLFSMKNGGGAAADGNAYMQCLGTREKRDDDEQGADAGAAFYQGTRTVRAIQRTQLKTDADNQSAGVLTMTLTLRLAESVQVRGADERDANGSFRWSGPHLDQFAAVGPGSCYRVTRSLETWVLQRAELDGSWTTLYQHPGLRKGISVDTCDGRTGILSACEKDGFVVRLPNGQKELFHRQDLAIQLTRSSERWLHSDYSRSNSGTPFVRLRKVTSSQEWYGWCLPSPRFLTMIPQLQNLPDMDLTGLWTDVHDIRDMVVGDLLATIADFIGGLVSWRCWWFSLSALLWFWACILRHDLALPSVPCALAYIILIAPTSAGRTLARSNPSRVQLTAGNFERLKKRGPRDLAIFLNRLLATMPGGVKHGLPGETGDLDAPNQTLFRFAWEHLRGSSARHDQEVELTIRIANISFLRLVASGLLRAFERSIQNVLASHSGISNGAVRMFSSGTTSAVLVTARIRDPPTSHQGLVSSLIDEQARLLARVEQAVQDEIPRLPECFTTATANLEFSGGYARLRRVKFTLDAVKEELQHVDWVRSDVPDGAEPFRTDGMEEARPGFLMVPTGLVPDVVEAKIRAVQQPVSRFNHHLSGAVDQLQRLLLWEDRQRSMRIVAALLVVGVLLHSRLRHILQLLFLVLVAGLGTSALLWNALFFRTLRTCFRATIEYRRSCGRRSLNAVRSWAFFSELTSEALVCGGPAVDLQG